jgi:hypothetical protein
MAQPDKSDYNEQINTEQNLLNNSYDRKFKVLAIELLSYDPLSGTDGALKRVTTNAMGEYQMNDKIDAGDVTYIGMEDAEGNWIIQKIDNTTGISRRFATVRNNPTYSSYTDAWADYLTITYSTYSQAL